MKKTFLVFCLMTISMVLSAQYAEIPAEQCIYMKGSRVFLDQEKLTKEQACALFSDINGIDRSEDYLKYRTGYKTGLGLTIGGSSVFFLGGMTFMAGTLGAIVSGIAVGMAGAVTVVAGGSADSVDNSAFNTVRALISAGGISSIAGVAMMAGGIPTLCVYKKRMKDMSHEYNYTAASSVKLTFGTQRHGIGLALNF